MDDHLAFLRLGFIEGRGPRNRLSRTVAVPVPAEAPRRKRMRKHLCGRLGLALGIVRAIAVIPAAVARLAPHEREDPLSAEWGMDRVSHESTGWGLLLESASLGKACEVEAGRSQEANEAIDQLASILGFALPHHNCLPSQV